LHPLVRFLCSPSRPTFENRPDCVVVLICGSETSLEGEQHEEAQADIYEIDVDKVEGNHTDTGVETDELNTIIEINKGLVQNWNDCHPEEAVRVGDRILGVNGISGNIQQIRKECKRNQHLCIRIRRCSSQMQKTWRSEIQALEDASGVRKFGPVPIDRGDQLYSVFASIAQDHVSGGRMPRISVASTPDGSWKPKPSVDTSTTRDTRNVSFGVEPVWGSSANESADGGSNGTSKGSAASSWVKRLKRLRHSIKDNRISWGSSGTSSR